MFDQLTARLTATLEGLRGRGRITEDNITQALRDTRVALLEADVALPVVKSFIDSVRAKALGAEVAASLTPGQAFIGILHEELIALMGGGGAGFSLRAQPPVVVVLAGLQGAGKTTTAAKLARRLIEREHKRVLLVSTDVRRPAAMLQLERLAAQVHAEYFSPEPGAAPEAIALAALAHARNGVFDVLIVDTAGRLHVDGELMEEVRRIDAAVGSAERLFVVDAMAGQDAVNAARAFAAALDLTGIILTKADGEEAARLARKVVKGQGFNLLDLRGQLEQLQKMGGVGALIDKLPGAVVKKGAVSAEQGDRDLRRQIAIINSMTPRERRNPGIIDGSRRRRIATGSGVQVQDVNRLLKQFQEMQRVMKSMKGGKLKRLMGAFKGGIPPGFPGR